MEEVTPMETHECQTRLQQVVFEIRHCPRPHTQTHSHPIAPTPTDTNLPAITPPSFARHSAYPHTCAPTPAHSYPQAYPPTPTSFTQSHSISAPSPSLSTHQPTPTPPQTHTFPPTTPAASLTQPDSFQSLVQEVLENSGTTSSERHQDRSFTDL